MAQYPPVPCLPIPGRYEWRPAGAQGLNPAHRAQESAWQHKRGGLREFTGGSLGSACRYAACDAHPRSHVAQRQGQHVGGTSARPPRIGAEPRHQGTPAPDRR